MAQVRFAARACLHTCARKGGDIPEKGRAKHAAGSHPAHKALLEDPADGMLLHFVDISSGRH